MEDPAKSPVKLPKKSLRRRAAASQSQVIDGENMSSIAASSSRPFDMPSTETKEDRNSIFEDDAPGANDLSFSIDKDESQSNDTDGSSTDGGSPAAAHGSTTTPEKIHNSNEIASLKTDVVNEHGKLVENIPTVPGQSNDEEDPVADLINSDGSIDALEIWSEGCAQSVPRTKRASTEGENSNLKKMRLDNSDEKFKTESKDNPELSTTCDKLNEGSCVEKGSSSSVLPNTSSYFSDLENSVLEKVSSIVDEKEKDVELLTQGSLSIEHLLKSNNCPLCLKWSDKIVVHVKNCAAKKNISTEKLFDAIKLQLKQHQEREAIGLPPLVQQPPTKKKNKKKAVSSAAAAAAVPEGYDSSIELAKALSVSSMESQESFGNVDAEISATKDATSKNTAPIFGSASSSSSVGKLKGGSTPLFNRTDEDRERIVTEKVAIVLLHSDEQDNLISESSPVIPSSSKMKETLNKSDRSRSPSLETESINVNDIDTENTQKHTKLNTPIAVCKLNKTSRSFRNNWKEMFVDRVMCDVTLVVEGGFEIAIHKLVLRAQCPAILDESTIKFSADNSARSFIVWNNIPRDVALAFFEYIYCEDLSKANNLTENKLQMFMGMIEKYKIPGLKFILKNIHNISETNISTHNRDIDEATTATNSSGDELSNAPTAEHAADDCRAPNSSPSDSCGILDDLENAAISNSISVRTPTVDKSKVVRYPFKKRSFQNPDSCSRKRLPSISNFNKRGKGLRMSSPSEETPNIDCVSQESFGDVQIIGEEKKTQQTSPVVITLSDDSDDDTRRASSTTSNTCKSSFTADRKGSTAFIPRVCNVGSKRIFESTDSDSEVSGELGEGTGTSNAWGDALYNLKTFQNNNHNTNKDSTKTDPKLLGTSYDADCFDPQKPSTSKAADLFEKLISERSSKNTTRLWKKSTGLSTMHHKNSFEPFGGQQFNETLPNSVFYSWPKPSSLFCDSSREMIHGYENGEGLFKSKSQFGESQNSSNFKLDPPLNDFHSNAFAEKLEPLNITDDDFYVPAQYDTNQPLLGTFHGSIKGPSSIPNRRKRHCSATITSSEMDALEAGAGKVLRSSPPVMEAPEFKDLALHETVLDSAVNTKSNVSLLNVDDEIFRNVQTPDTSATNNMPVIKGEESLVLNKTDGLDNAEHQNQDNLNVDVEPVADNTMPVELNIVTPKVNKFEPIFIAQNELPQKKLIQVIKAPKAQDRLLVVVPPASKKRRIITNAKDQSISIIPSSSVFGKNRTKIRVFIESRDKKKATKNEDPIIPAPNEDPIIPAPNEDPIIPAPKEVPIIPAPHEDPIIPAPNEVPIIPAPNEAPIIPAPNEVPIIPAPNEAPIIPAPNEVPNIPAPNEAPINTVGDVVAAQAVVADQVNHEVLVEPVHSPRPNFNKMKKQELMEHLEKYGVKTNMTVMRARKLLNHIYVYTHQEIPYGKGKKMLAKKAYDRDQLQNIIDLEEKTNSKNKRGTPVADENVAEFIENDTAGGNATIATDPEINAELKDEEERANQMTFLAERLSLFRQSQKGGFSEHFSGTDERGSASEIYPLKNAFNNGDALSDTYRELLELENKRVIINKDEFECPTCFDIVEVGGGIVLKDCAHPICRTCLSRLVQSSDEPLINCPCCTSIIQEREIKEVVAPEIFERYLSKSIAVTANSIENAFHCKTPDCRGWCIIDDIINQPVIVFNCPVCLIANCIQCQATHPSMNCLQYQNHLAIQAEKDPVAKKSLLYLEKLKNNKKALNCPKCQIIIVKTEGCDWIQCSMCKCEICWATMGPRWGPKGFGDVSGGCRCKMNGGPPCTIRCRNCH